jgi:uncharacterized protein
MAMRLFVDRIEGTPTSERFEAAADWWSDRAEVDAAGFEMVEAPVFALNVHRMGRDLYLDGTLQALVEATCSRCLKRYRQPLRDAWRLVLEPADGVAMPDPESARALAQDGICLGEELEVGWYQGKELALDRFFDEVVALALPIVPLCDEDCPGLCPVCGRDLSTQDCNCEPTLPDSPFAALAALRTSDAEPKS